MAKILIVDDEEDQEELIMQKFGNKEYLKKYEFLFARNGLKGLELVKEHSDIDFVLLDINMPEMDGLTLLQKIKEYNPMIQAIMLSAYGDMSNVRTAMNRGAFDFLNKPIELKDLEATIKKTISEVNRLKENAKTVQENLALKQKATELEMQALRAQMNPHFIFNSLNSINNFILQNEKDKASEYLIKFSQLIRLILENSMLALISLGNELQALKLYIELERLRFKQQFEYQISISDELDLESIKVPPLILQPFIENAIHHGLLLKEGPGFLKLDIAEQNNVLLLTIEDNGIGREMAGSILKQNQFKQQSLGMKITEERMVRFAMGAGGKHSVSINDLVHPDGKPAGTQIKATIPIYI